MTQASRTNERAILSLGKRRATHFKPAVVRRNDQQWSIIHHFRRRQSDGRWVSTQKLGKVKDFKSELKLSFFSALFITFSITFFVYNTSVKRKKENTKLSNSERKTVLLAGFIPG